ncbi:MAG: DinB family protein [Chloroflexota bacterium]|nr:DinB family protein [Chloroflexota bacterium]
MTTRNTKIEAIRQDIQSSYYELNRLIAGPLLQLEPEKLYQPPAPGEWTLMENIAHILEFMPYWADQIAQLVAQPGQNFGRTAQDENRIHAIAEHSTDTLAQAAAVLPDSYAHLDRVLSTLQDDDLQLTGQHSRFGEKQLEWFIEEFVTQHLTNHIQQMKEALTQQGTWH